MFCRTGVGPEVKAAVWGWIFAEAPEFWCDLAEVGGRVVGMVQYQLMQRSLSGAKVCHPSDLDVRPEVRGGGVGRGLIDHVIGFAKARRIKNVRWLMQEFNHAGRGFCDSYRSKSLFILYSAPVEGQGCRGTPRPTLVDRVPVEGWGCRGTPRPALVDRVSVEGRGCRGTPRPALVDRVSVEG